MDSGGGSSLSWDAIWAVIGPAAVLFLMRMVDSFMPKGWAFRWMPKYMTKLEKEKEDGDDEHGAS